nr:uncharacterized mitochondrial protein AtMg00810-like [Tanacetum cinerariifolium]
VKSASTPVDLEKHLVKDRDANDIDVHLYRSMIGSSMYLTSSRPDIMFAAYACARFQVTPKTSHLLAIKRIFRYLKGKPTLGLWYLKDSPFELVAYTDSDYAGATQDRKSTTGGCQFLGNRLISWQCKKQTVVATSTTEAEYVAAAIIYVSLIHQFWETASSSTSEKTKIVITATIDGRVKSVTEASIRRHLKLEDYEGIRSLPNTEIFKKLALMGTFNFLKMIFEGMLKNLDNKSKFLMYPSNMRQASKGYSMVDVPLFPAMLIQGPLLQSDPTISPPLISSPSRVPTLLHDLPLPRGNTPGSEEGRFIINELTVFCTSLSKKVESLESDLKQIKLTYGAAYTKLIMKGRNEHEVESNFDLATAKDISTVNVPVTTAGVEISTASPEYKTAETFNDSDEITLVESLIEIRRSAIKPQKEFFERRKKQLAAERSEAIRNKPPTRTQVRNRMITYLKHMGKYTHQQLKHKSLELQKLHQKEQKWIDDFKPMDDDSKQQVESNKKRQREVSNDKSFKKQKLEEDNDVGKEELRSILDIVPRDDIAINVESLATKYPIVDWKTYVLTENMMYYQIINADGSSKNYKIFSEMLDDFDRRDVIDLHRLVQERKDHVILGKDCKSTRTPYTIKGGSMALDEYKLFIVGIDQSSRSTPVNIGSYFVTTVDSGRERAQRNKFASMFGQDKDANGNMMFTPVNVARSTYDTRIFSSAYENEVEGAKDDFNNLELTKVVYKNKKDEIGIVVRNKARLVAQGYTQEERIDYDEVFAPVARIKAIRLFLAYASFMEFIVYQMDVKSAFLYGIIEGGVMQRYDGIFISQDKSMIRSLMYLTASRPDIMFVVCACTRFQVTPKVSHLHVVTRIFRFLKGQPKLGFWYTRDSPFDLEPFSNSDYTRASLDRKSTTGGCQFLRKRLISCQCKKQIVVATQQLKQSMLLLLIAMDMCYGSKIKCLAMDSFS